MIRSKYDYYGRNTRSMRYSNADLERFRSLFLFTPTSPGLCCGDRRHRPAMRRRNSARVHSGYINRQIPSLPPSGLLPNEIEMIIAQALRKRSLR